VPHLRVTKVAAPVLFCVACHDHVEVNFRVLPFSSLVKLVLEQASPPLSPFGG